MRLVVRLALLDDRQQGGGDGGGARDAAGENARARELDRACGRKGKNARDQLIFIWRLRDSLFLNRAGKPLSKPATAASAIQRRLLLLPGTADCLNKTNLLVFRTESEHGNPPREGAGEERRSRRRPRVDDPLVERAVQRHVQRNGGHGLPGSSERRDRDRCSGRDQQKEWFQTVAGRCAAIQTLSGAHHHERMRCASPERGGSLLRRTGLSLSLVWRRESGALNHVVRSRLGGSTPRLSDDVAQHPERSVEEVALQ